MSSLPRIDRAVFRSQAEARRILAMVRPVDYSELKVAADKQFPDLDNHIEYSGLKETIMMVVIFCATVFPYVMAMLYIWYFCTHLDMREYIRVIKYAFVG